MAKTKHPEQDIQKAIIRFIRLQYRDAICFFIPNGSNVGKRVGGIYQSMGLLAGVADICVLWEPGRVGFLEVKSATGTTSEKQDAFCFECMRLGVPYAVVRSIDDARAVLDSWGVPSTRRASNAA